MCLPPCGGSGLKFLHAAASTMPPQGLPPCGGSGLKFWMPSATLTHWESPSMRREWIEISSHSAEQTACLSPSMRREWIEMPETVHLLAKRIRLPPCGGSGLKYGTQNDRKSVLQSPSMRREWIEISADMAVCHPSLMSPSMRREWIEIRSPDLLTRR